jgi:hypothetical protein
MNDRIPTVKGLLGGSKKPKKRRGLLSGLPKSYSPDLTDNQLARRSERWAERPRFDWVTPFDPAEMARAAWLRDMRGGGGGGGGGSGGGGGGGGGGGRFSAPTPTPMDWGMDPMAIRDQLIAEQTAAMQNVTGGKMPWKKGKR